MPAPAEEAAGGYAENTACTEVRKRDRPAMSRRAGEADKIVLPKRTGEPQVTGRFQANTHYVKLTTAQGTSSPPDVIEVAEVFWYGCPHCFTFDPIIKDWAEKHYRTM